MNKLEKKLKSLLLFLYCWRDALGINILGVPLRFGEISAAFFCLIPLFNGCKLRIRTKESIILWILVVNFLISLTGVIFYFSEIDVSFAIKYIARNVIFLILMLGFLSSDINFTKQNLGKLFDFFTIIQILSFVLVFTTGTHVLMGEILGWADINSTGQFVTILGICLPRFAGTCAEAGYLAPLFPITTYYYLSVYMSSYETKVCSHCLFFLSMILLMTLFTFSTAVYVFVGFTFLITFFMNFHQRKSQTILFFLLIFGFLLLTIIATNESIQQYILKEVLNKIAVYLSLDNDINISNWSAMDRSQHVENAISLFCSGSFLEMLFGHGTGAYSDYASRQTTLLVTDVNEAYNLFLSSLTDRGILGLVCVVLVLFYCKIFWIKNDKYSTALFVGILSQFVHWLLTGNFWLYYFWYEIIFLVGYYRNSRIIRN